MSFAQTTSAEGVPTAIQNGYESLHIVDAVAGVTVTNNAFTLSKTLAVGAPPGRYHALGTINVQCNAPVSQWVAILIVAGGVPIQVYSLHVPPAIAPSPSGYMEIPVTFPLPVIAGTSLFISLASQTSSAQYLGADILLIRA